MLLTYLDESYTRDRYFIAAVVIPESSVIGLTSALDAVVNDVARDWRGDVQRDAELHGYDLVAGKRDWAGLATRIRVRIGVYNRALQAVADHGVAIVVRSVDIAGLNRRHPDTPAATAIPTL